MNCATFLKSFWIVACLYIHLVWELLYIFWYDYASWPKNPATGRSYHPYNVVALAYDMYGKIDQRYSVVHLK